MGHGALGIGHWALVLTCTEQRRSSVAVGAASRREVLGMDQYFFPYSPTPFPHVRASNSLFHEQ
ncbi:hypothetical protein [Nostoc sp.]|uniref:hypothetical protein n=1 Tax=Nostoc sp. TaxID=1180 RepID=UPI002FFC05D5